MEHEDIEPPQDMTSPVISSQGAAAAAAAGGEGPLHACHMSTTGLHDLPDGIIEVRGGSMHACMIRDCIGCCTPP